MDQIIKELEQDIQYFKNLGFDNLAKKFQRDLEIINSLAQNKS